MTLLTSGNWRCSTCARTKVYANALHLPEQLHTLSCCRMSSRDLPASSSARRIALSETLWHTQTIMVTPLQGELAAFWMAIRKRRAVNSNENDSCLDYSRIIAGVQAFFLTDESQPKTASRGVFREGRKGLGGCGGLRPLQIAQ